MFGGVCPQCGLSSVYIMVQGHTIAACSNCAQATVFEANKIIQLPLHKLEQYHGAKRELLMVALTAEALFKNWEIIIHPTPYS